MQGWRENSTVLKLTLTLPLNEPPLFNKQVYNRTTNALCFSVWNELIMTLIYVAESGDIKASVAVLGFIFSSAAKYDVDSESLSSELQQLGLPKG